MHLCVCLAKAISPGAHELCWAEMNCRESSELCREAVVFRAGRRQQLKQVESGAWACGFMIHDYSFRLLRAVHISEQSEIGDSLDFVEQPQKHAGKREPRPYG